MSKDEENSTNENDKEEFLEFKDEEIREKDRIKLRESSFGDLLSQSEIDRFLLVKDRLSRLLREKKEQQGLVYILHLKKKNTNIDEEIKETGDEYSELLSKVRVKTGYSNEEVEEYIEGGREKKIRRYLIDVTREKEEELKEKSPIKKNLFLIFKDHGKEKKSPSLVAVALVGIPINVPQYGIVSIITSGLRSEYLPFVFNPKDKNSLFFLLRTALAERKAGNFSVGAERIDYSSEEEFELRNIKIEIPEPVIEEPKVVEKTKEEIIIEEIPKIVAEEPTVELSKIQKEPQTIEKSKEIVVEEFGSSFKEKEPEKPIVVELEPEKPQKQTPRKFGIEDIEDIEEELLTGKPIKDNKN
jgi:hypothetical protein